MVPTPAFAILIASSLFASGPGLAPRVVAFPTPQEAESAESLAGEAQDSDSKEVAPEDRTECVIELRDGRVLSGEVVSRTDALTIVRIGGIEVAYENELIVRYEQLPPVMERYASMRQTLASDDVAGRLFLARWLRDRDLYDVALHEIDLALRAEPNHPDAVEMRRRTEAMKVLYERKGLVEETDGAQRIPRPKRPDMPMLTPEQVNLIKVFEVDLTDPPRMHVERNVIDHIFEDYGDHELVPRTPEGRAALYRRRPVQVLNLLFRMKARDLYNEVEILDHPSSMRKFRDDVHRTWLINGCATTRCHGGVDAGRLWLQPRNSNSDVAVYTNFLILERFRTSDDLPLIDYDRPAESALLQMAMPRQDAVVAHPEVEGWRPIFRSTNDRRFRDAVEWIRSMYLPRPEYPIEFEPPVPPGYLPPEPDR